MQFRPRRSLGRRGSLTTHHSPLTTHHSPLTAHHLSLVTLHSSLCIDFAQVLFLSTIRYDENGLTDIAFFSFPLENGRGPGNLLEDRSHEHHYRMPQLPNSLEVESDAYRSGQDTVSPMQERDLDSALGVD